MGLVLYAAVAVAARLPGMGEVALQRVEDTGDGTLSSWLKTLADLQHGMQSTTSVLGFAGSPVAFACTQSLPSTLTQEERRARSQATGST